jgi:hypothetical protein
MFSIASAIVSSQGFSSPYWAETGPTAQQTPGFPYFLAALYYVGGGSMDFAVRALVGLNVVFSALTCMVIIAVGNRLQPGHGNLFGWAWAALPILGFTEVVFLWDTALYTLILILLIWLLLKIVEGERLASFFWWGALAGASLLLNPAHILVLGFILSILWLMNRISLLQIAISTGAIALIIGPWIIRNNIELGYPSFIRSNIGFEIHSALVTGPWGQGNPNELNPGRNPIQLALYKELGEYRYMAEQSHLAKQLFINDPSFALRRAAGRMIVFWTGNDEVGWRDSWFSAIIRMAVDTRIADPLKPLFKHVLFAIPSLAGFLGMLFLIRESKDRVAAAVIASIILIFPLPYYVALTLPRYRTPIEPFLLLLSVYGLLRFSWRYARKSLTSGSKPREMSCARMAQLEERAEGLDRDA